MNLPWQATACLPPDVMARVRRRAIFECCKWDPQVEDTDVLAGFALLLSLPAWHQLAGWAETLYAETLAAELEIAGRADLLRMLGLPPGIERILAAAPPAVKPGPRVMRFDFHFTTEGWRISEVNSDVPGGYIESTGFTQLMAGQFPGCTPIANPVAGLLRSLAGHRLWRKESCAMTVLMGEKKDSHGRRHTLRLPFATAQAGAGAAPLSRP